MGKVQQCITLAKIIKPLQDKKEQQAQARQIETGLEK